MTKKKKDLAPEYINMLGNVTDSEISRLSGVSVYYVRKERLARGIEGSKKRSRYMGADTLEAGGYLELLGKLSDTDLARKAGVSASSVKYLRQKMGIKSLSKSTRRAGFNYDHLLEHYSNREIAEMVGITQMAVGQRRKAVKSGRKRHKGSMESLFSHYQDDQLAELWQVPIEVVRQRRSDYQFKEPSKRPETPEIKAVRITPEDLHKAREIGGGSSVDGISKALNAYNEKPHTLYLEDVETPIPEQITAFREQVQKNMGMKITAAQDYCAEMVHVDRRSWQKWERGERSMHPAFWELAQVKSSQCE